eukprot:Platyproteum_vivax@DN8506_c0_g1_i1.p1
MKDTMEKKLRDLKALVDLSEDMRSQLRYEMLAAAELRAASLERCAEALRQSVMVLIERGEISPDHIVEATKILADNLYELHNAASLERKRAKALSTQMVANLTTVELVAKFTRGCWRCDGTNNNQHVLGYDGKVPPVIITSSNSNEFVAIQELSEQELAQWTLECNKDNDTDNYSPTNTNQSSIVEECETESDFVHVPATTPQMEVDNDIDILMIKQRVGVQEGAEGINDAGVNNGSNDGPLQKSLQSRIRSFLGRA